MRSVLVWLLVLFGSVFWGVSRPPTPARADPQDPPACHPAELFATDSTDPLFELQADMTIAQSRAAVTGSTALDGIYWSKALQQATRETSREFHLCVADAPTLHTAAEGVRRQFNQEAVLTFDYLPERAPGVDAVVIRVPDIDIGRFRDAFAADSPARDRLQGGSVTATDHTLILVAANGDLDVARRLVGAAGGNWDAADIAYGRAEFVHI